MKVLWRQWTHQTPSPIISTSATVGTQPGDDDYLMNEIRRKPTTGRQSPALFDKWHVIFYMPSRIDEAGHTKAFDYPVAEHWGNPEIFSSAGGTRTDNTSVRSRTRYQLSHPGSPRGSHNPGSSTGGSSPNWGDRR